MVDQTRCSATVCASIRPNEGSSLTNERLGVAPSAIGFVLWGYAVSRLGVGRAGTGLYLVPAVAILIAWGWLGEVPGRWELTGGLVALLGVGWANTGHFSRSIDVPSRTDR